MKVHVIRTAMIGGGLSYDVYVPVSECPEFLRETGKYRCSVTHIGRDSYRNGKHSYYINFPEATCPESHFAMPQGWDRYEDWKKHEADARRRMLDIAETVFPELSKVREKTDKLPSLWCCDLLSGKETSAEFIVEVRA
jgi:hypothetical protein